MTHIDIQLVSDIVRAASTYMDRTGGFEVHDKGARENIVTSSDLAVQHFLTEQLHMRYEDGSWGFYKFNGKNKWNSENNIENKKYMLNAYRVLLTRARQGIVICVPKGNSNLTPEGFPEDPTRLPEFYDGTYEYLKGLGMKDLEETRHD